MQTLFKLVYGLEDIFPMEYSLPILRIVAFTEMDDTDTIHERLSNLAELEEDRFIAGFHQQIQKE
jgi:hypothetical protein